MRFDDDLKYFEEPEFKEILDRYEFARSTGQGIYMDAEDLTDVAEYYALVVQDNELANDAISLALKLHPHSVDPQIFKARQYMLSGNPDKALSICDSIEDQSHREVLFLRAELLIRSNNTDEAALLLQDAITEITEDKDYFIFDSAYIFIDYQQYDWALAFANNLEQIAPKWYKTWQLFADIYLGQGNNKQALDYLSRMLDVDPFCIEAWNWEAEAYSNLGDLAKAYEATEYALAVEPDNERSLQLKAWILLQQTNSKEAHDLYQRLERMNPTNASHWLFDSYALLDMDQIDDAYLAVKQAETLADDEFEDWVSIFEQMAQVLSRQGRVSEALEYISKAENARTGGAEIYDNRLLRVRVYAENNLLPDALLVIHGLMEKYPQEALDIYYDGATVLFDFSYFETVVAMLTELEAQSEVVNPNLYAILAYSEMSLGHHENALKNIRKAVEAHASSLADLFADKFPNVKVEELYDYYYYQVYGHWPK